MRQSMQHIKNIFYSNAKVNPTTHCWEWIKHKDSDGYGQFRFLTKYFQAHRFSFDLSKGDLPNHLLVCHSCDNPSCINPEHLFLGTPLTNTQDMIKKNRYHRGPRKMNGSKDGSKNSYSKLIEADVVRIRELYGSGKFTQRMLAKKYKIGQSSISRMVNGITWDHV